MDSKLRSKGPSSSDLSSEFDLNQDLSGLSRSSGSYFLWMLFFKSVISYSKKRSLFTKREECFFRFYSSIAVFFFADT